MDINPSIELSVNRFDRVIAVTGFNEDGQVLSRELDVKYKDYAQAVEQVLCYDSVAAPEQYRLLFRPARGGGGRPRGGALLWEIQSLFGITALRPGHHPGGRAGHDYAGNSGFD